MWPSSRGHARDSICNSRDEVLLQFLKPREVSSDEPLLLGTSPSLQLPFAASWRQMVGEYFGVNQIDWQASRGKDTGSPFAMTSEPRLDVIGFADVKRAIRTAQNVHEVHATTTMASSIA